MATRTFGFLNISAAYWLLIDKEERSFYLLSRLWGMATETDSALTNTQLLDYSFMGTNYL